MSDLTIAFALYDRMTALDTVGPMEVLRFIPGVELRFVAESAGPVNTDAPPMTLTATSSFDEVTDPDVVIVPGGPGTAQVLDGPLTAWLQEIHPRTRWTTSVCSGSVVLAAAGLLDDTTATSHFSVLELLDGFGAQPSTERVVVDAERRIMTSAGVSAGIDMGLTLAADLTDALTAQAIQLVIEYEPRPPFDTGSLARASSEVVDRAIEIGRPVGAIPEFWKAPAPS